MKKVLEVKWKQMTYRYFITNLPINNFHRFTDYEYWLGFYSHHYPINGQQEEIYRIDNCYDFFSP